VKLETGKYTAKVKVEVEVKKMNSENCTATDY